MTASSQRIGLNRNAGFAGAGRRVIISVDILTSGDTGLTPFQLLRFGTATAEQYYVDGNTYSSGNVVGPCTLSLAYDSPTSGNTTPFFGVGANTTATGTVKFANPRFGLWGGVAPLPYLANTSTTAERHDPRFDHDPTTLAPRGLLVEVSASNLWTYSQDQSQWAVNNVTVNTGTQATAPDGATSLFPVLTNNTGVVQYFVRQRSADTISATSGQTYTYSMFVKKGTHRYVQMFASATTIFTNPAQANFDLDDGTTGNVTNCTPNAVSYSNGWWRLSITVTANSTASQAQPFIMYLVSSKTAARAENHSLTSASVYVWGAQVELGSGASSYLPTGASTGLRNAESCVMTGTNFSSWYGTPTSASVLYEGTIVQPSDQFRRIAVFSSTVSSSTVANFSLMVSGNQNNRPALNSFINSANNVDAYVPLAGAVTNGTQFRLAARVASGNHRISRAGQSATSSYSTAPGFPQGIVALSFGSDGSLMPSHWIRQLKYYPFSLTNAQMDAWSA
jgi:hypothetical protein